MKYRPNWLALVAALMCASWLTAASADLDEIRARGELRHLGIPYANFVTGLGDGMSVELAKGFAAHLGVQYQFVRTDWPDIIGHFDIVRKYAAQIGLTTAAPAYREMALDALAQIFCGGVVE